jgi:ADP-ribosylglycohydrolase
MTETDHPSDRSERLARARRSLDGLSTGDAFGERFFVNPDVVESLIEQRALPAGLWRYTDDTVMAIAIVEILEDHGFIAQDFLAESFARKYALDPGRGYGGTAHAILRDLGAGLPWRVVSPEVFSGQGSMGNGAAMRAGPIGAYFADDLDAAAENARLSAEVTHAHPEGQAGAIAVAVAAAWIASAGTSGGTRGTRAEQMFDAVLHRVPDGETKAVIARAAALPREYDVRTAVAALGNGTRVIAQDTVPFALWCAARHLDDYEEALWTTVSGLGDRDTTCAIVGSIVALAGKGASIPEDWLRSREPLEVMSRKRREGLG